MMKGFIRYRPKNLVTVYVESRQVEVLRASRKWRTWEIEQTERYTVPDGESVLDYIQFLNLRPRGRKGSALLLFVPATFYSVHREHYPLSLKDQIEEAVNFDWQENIFHETDSTLHFFGPGVPLDHHISVPIFAMHRTVYEKLHLALNAQQFQIFSVMPSALAYETFLPSPVPGQPEEPLQIIGRILDDSQLEVHRFYRGALLDSMLIGKSRDDLRLFRENLRCMGEGGEDSPAESAPHHINFLCTGAECGGGRGDYGSDWSESGLPMRLRNIDGSFVTNWVKRLLEQESVYTFDNEILLKPWQLPRIVWPIAGLILLFAVFALWEVGASGRLIQADKGVRRQLNQLEIQWKPIEELQTRISKFQEDKKTLSEFNREGYPLIELLTYLTMITPDDTWINYISLRKGQVVIRGESKSAIKYLSELSKTEGLTDVKFASPVTRNPSSDMERFNVQLQLDMEKLNKSLEAMPLDKLAPAIKAASAGAGDVPGTAPGLPAGTEGSTGEEQIIPDEKPAAPQEAGQ